MNNEIGIVIFFFDIGRGNWTPDKGFPHYLHRTTDTYFERFSHLAQLENPMVIYTSPEYVDKIKSYRVGKEDKTVVVPFDYHNLNGPLRARIHGVQMNKEFIEKVNPSQRINPEYWNPDYILMMFLKSWFVNDAIERGLMKSDMVAYMDFGWCRSAGKIPASKRWEFDFDPNKIHLFGYDDRPIITNIMDVIFNNIVYILGAQLVAPKNLWGTFHRMLNDIFTQLLWKDIVDDDQTLYLMAYIRDPSLFQIHKIPDHQNGHDPFVLLSDFNKAK